MNGRSIRFSQPLVTCLLFLAVISKPLSSDATPSSRPGYGSTVYGDAGGTGVTFRVWAPNATNVTVAATFNSFSWTANPLYSEGGGVWSVDVPGAHIGNQYKYVIYSVNGTNLKQDPRCRQQASSTDNSIVYNGTNFDWTGDTFTYVPQNDAVIYELNIGSFNDPNPSDGNPGTFLSATNMLAFLKQLGISAIEVMPINEFPGNFSWGYNLVDIFGVESSYGGPNQFKTFVKTCHQFGLGVLVDVVHNHYGPTEMDLWRFDGSFTSGGPAGGYGGIYFYQSTGLCCTPYGSTRPNYSTQQVRNFIQDSFSMWLNECHVDGFRWDSPGYMMNSDAGFNTDAQTLIQQCSSLIHTGYVGKINIGEDQGWLSGTAGFDSTWANVFYDDVTGQLTPSSDASRNMATIETAVKLNTPGGVGAGGWGNVLFMENHDKAGDLNNAQRLPVQIDGGNPTSYFARKRSTLGAALTLTTPGMPMILQGEEMLTTNQFGASNALDWSRTNTYSGIVSLYQDLIHLRRNLDGRSSGLKGLNVSTMQRDDSNKLYAYRRWDTGNVGDDVVVICNFANTTWSNNYGVNNFPHSGTWYTLLNSDSTEYGSDYSNVGPASISVLSNVGTISIAPYSVLILSQVAPPPPPVALFTGSPTNGTSPLVVTFTDTSSNSITSRSWDFGDNSTTNITTNTVAHTYAAGTYTVTLVATGPGGVSTNTKPNYITVLPAPSTITVDVGYLYDRFGTAPANLVPTNSVAVLVVDTGNNGFVDPQPGFPLSLGATWGTDDRIVGIWDPGGCGSGDGTLFCDTVVTYTNGIALGQTLQLYWFPSLTLASNTVGVTYYGKFTDTNSPPLDGSDAWQMPANGSSAYLIFWTVSNQGSNPDAAGQATLSTGGSLSAFQNWQIQYFTTTNNPAASPNADPDGDGQSNMAEFLVGTDPTNSASAFRITSVVRVNTNVLVTWTMGSNRTNALQATAGGPGGSYSTNGFTDIFTVTNTIGSVTNYLDSGAATNFPARYYRVRLVP